MLKKSLQFIRFVYSEEVSRITTRREALIKQRVEYFKSQESILKRRLENLFIYSSFIVLMALIACLVIFLPSTAPHTSTLHHIINSSSISTSPALLAQVSPPQNQNTFNKDVTDFFQAYPFQSVMLATFLGVIIASLFKKLIRGSYEFIKEAIFVLVVVLNVLVEFGVRLRYYFQVFRGSSVSKPQEINITLKNHIIELE